MSNKVVRLREIRNLTFQLSFASSEDCCSYIYQNQRLRLAHARIYNQKKKDGRFQESYLNFTHNRSK